MDTRKEERWQLRYNIWIARHPTLPGVWARKEGGFFVRGKVLDPRTGRRVELKKVVTEVDGREASRHDAYRFLRQELEKLKEKSRGPSASMLFADYARALYERKIAKNKIRSAKGREKWETTLRRHLLPRFGKMEVRDITPTDVERWLEDLGRRVAAGETSPLTVNGYFAILKVILRSAWKEFDLRRDPTAGVEPLGTRDWVTHSAEEPNSLLEEEVQQFLAKMKELYPQHFAFCVLGFATGLRPSSLRPLRRSGPTPDVRWDEGILLVRRSQTRGDGTMQTTKQGTRYPLTMPDEMMKILSWHVASLEPGPMTSSDLLFPSETGGFRSMSTLDKPFRVVGRKIGITKRFTPCGMRRTYQDLMRRANVSDIVARQICGHATVASQVRYSSVSDGEGKEAMGKIISIIKVKEMVGGRSAAGAALGGCMAFEAPKSHEDKNETGRQTLDGKEVLA